MAVASPLPAAPSCLIAWPMAGISLLGIASHSEVGRPGTGTESLRNSGDSGACQMTIRELIARKSELRSMTEPEQRLFFCECYRAVMLWREKQWRVLPEIELAERYARGEDIEADLAELCRHRGEGIRSLVTGDALALAEECLRALEWIDYKPPMRQRSFVYEGD